MAGVCGGGRSLRDGARAFVRGPAWRPDPATRVELSRAQVAGRALQVAELPPGSQGPQGGQAALNDIFRTRKNRAKRAASDMAKEVQRGAEERERLAGGGGCDENQAPERPTKRPWGCSMLSGAQRYNLGVLMRTFHSHLASGEAATIAHAVGCTAREVVAFFREERTLAHREQGGRVPPPPKERQVLAPLPPLPAATPPPPQPDVPTIPAPRTSGTSGPGAAAACTEAGSGQRARTRYSCKLCKALGAKALHSAGSAECPHRGRVFDEWRAAKKPTTWTITPARQPAPRHEC
mmetsp:Transcript_16152/g.55049  ORF Transcript_16152/g.55049 Transcript_16152/m.55049 type:complete len:293 (+) Transcript_16152:390-1268(+)